MSQGELIPFGKYKGQPVEVLAQDKQYVDWLMGQPWFRAKHAGVYTLIVNNFGAPAETPEHNALQALFTDEEWVKGFVIHVYGRDKLASVFRKALRREKERLAGYITGSKYHGVWAGRYSWRAVTEWIDGRQSGIKGWAELSEEEETERQKFIRDLLVAEDVIMIWVSIADFEIKGMDVVFHFGLRLPNEGEVDGWTGIERSLAVECKPVLGDDYPAVLRQMKADYADYERVLLVGYGGYKGTGASLEQVRKIFASASIEIVFLSDIPVKTSEEEVLKEIRYNEMMEGALER